MEIFQNKKCCHNGDHSHVGYKHLVDQNFCKYKNIILHTTIAMFNSSLQCFSLYFIVGGRHLCDLI